MSIKHARRFPFLNYYLMPYITLEVKQAGSDSPLVIANLPLPYFLKEPSLLISCSYISEKKNILK